VPAPEHRPDQAETEDHAHRRKDHGDEQDRVGERIANRMPGQDAADGQVDPVDDGDSNPDGPHDALDVMAEVPGRDDHDSQREQREQVQGLLGPRFIGGQAAARAVHSRVITGAAAWPLGIVVHGHQRPTGKLHATSFRSPASRRLATSPPGPVDVGRS
jgi:hypothetical protein